MKEKFINQYPINVDFDFAHTTSLKHHPSVFPIWPESLFLQSNWPVEGAFMELEFTGWRDESLAKHNTCAVSNSLSPAPPVHIIKGPEALKFFSEHLVNSFAKFQIGTGKHAIMCNDDGNIIMQGVLYRLGEEEFEANTLMTLPYVVETCGKKYDMTLEDVTSNRFLLQTSGLRTLELIEELTGDDFHDLKFCHFRMSTIDGMPVRIYRFGMSGCLGYEISGDVQYASEVYRRVIEVGNKYGIRRMGGRAYIMNHTPGGFLQYGNHYQNALMDDKNYVDAMTKKNGQCEIGLPVIGSFDGSHKELFANPIEYGCVNVVKFDHDFPGRAALEKIAANPRKKMVTLEWNEEDLAVVYASQFRDEDAYQPMDYPVDKHFTGSMGLSADKVLDESGKMIGVSTHRTYDVFYHKMLSLCAIDLAYSEIGTEVTIVWGNPEFRQKKIRAKVSRFPYNNHYDNRTFDTNTIPRLNK